MGLGELASSLLTGEVTSSVVDSVGEAKAGSTKTSVAMLTDEEVIGESKHSLSSLG